MHELHQQWPDVQLLESNMMAGQRIGEVFDGSTIKPIKIWLSGNPFQLNVWQALLAIPEGSHATCGQIAKAIGKADASRAAGKAIGNKPIAWIIPYHWIIRKLGELGAIAGGHV